MSIGNTHIIHKQTLDVSLTSDKNATDIQEQLKELLYTRSMPVIEKVLDQAANEDEHIYIERLEVDLGKLDPSKATHDILNKLHSKLEQAIHEQLVTNRTLQDKTLDQTKNNIDKKNRVLRYTPAQAIKSAFFNYLVRGILPVRFHHYTIQQLEKEIIEQAILQETVVTELAELSSTHPHIIKRIIYQFSPSFIEKLLLVKRNFYAQYEGTGLRLFHQWLLQKEMDQHVTMPVSHQLTRLFDGQLLVMLFYQPDITKQNIIKNLLDALRKMPWFPLNQDKKQKWIQAIQAFHGIHDEGAKNPVEHFSWQLLRDLKTHKEVQKPSHKASEKESGTAMDHEVQEKASHDQHDSSIPDNKNLLKDEMSESFSREYMKSLFNEPEQYKEAEPYYINNAGLVLLTPYLQLFFKEIGLLDDSKQFVDTEAQTKAIYLLHDLAWGDDPAGEPDLVFNKILSGMPVEIPVLPDNPITDDEKAACEEMLNAVIRNWGALKNTSPQGLREAFLQRNGKLLMNESNMKLTVEKSAMDVLLDRLPWSYNIVKQPWMKQIIFVNWT